MKLKKLKLNALSEMSMEDKEMNALRGGSSACGCSCYWEGTADGSSVEDNAKANYQRGASSVHGCNEFSYPGPYGEVVEHDVVDAS